MRRFLTYSRNADGDLVPAVSDVPPEPKVSPRTAVAPPPHVLKNYELNHELEAELLNRGNSHSESKARATAMKRFQSVTYAGKKTKSRDQVRADYFNELADAITGIESFEQPPVQPCEKSYEDVIKAFGGRFAGESQVSPGRWAEILEQT